MADGHHLPVDATAHAGGAHARVDVVGKVEHGGAFREFQQVALRREHEHFVVVEVHFEMVHSLLVVACLECLADVREPFVDARLLRFHAFVAPVGGQSALGNLVHSFGANLHLHPFLLGSQDGDV